jgi:hypothetical protein
MPIGTEAPAAGFPIHCCPSRLDGCCAPCTGHSVKSQQCRQPAMSRHCSAIATYPKAVAQGSGSAGGNAGHCNRALSPSVVMFHIYYNFPSSVPLFQIPESRRHLT